MELQCKILQIESIVDFNLAKVIEDGFVPSTSLYHIFTVLGMLKYDGLATN